MTNGEISFDFESTKENEKILKELLSAKGLVHYIIETKEKEKLDLIEYKDYQQLEQELQEYKENYECILRPRDDISKNATEQIESLIDEKNKYKSLYENEKDHTDTLKRIIKKIEEYIIDQNDWEICSKYDAIYKDEVLYILDLLKEIK